MKVKLVRHNFPDRPDWIVVCRTIPIGKIYEVMGYESNMVIYNMELHSVKKCDCFLLRDSDGVEGYLPTAVFEEYNDSTTTKETESKESKAVQTGDSAPDSRS